ncbi:MAG: hypothetical protein ABR601_08390 [Parasphingopyxis sp.]|nr:hypothetical protein [Sphingomonadales bacterium]
MPRWLKILLIVIGAVVALKLVGAIAFSLIGMLFTVAVLAAVGYGAYYLVSGGDKRLPPR